MSKNRKEGVSKQPKRKSDISQFGFFNVAAMNPTLEMEDGDEDDEDLEAELMQILGPGGNDSRGSSSRKAKPIVPKANLDSMIAQSLRDIPSDESLSEDEDDPSLLAELQHYTGERVEESKAVSSSAASESSKDLEKLIQERIENYKEAEASAKSGGDAAKARRLGRGLNSLEELLKKARRGLAIDENDIPLPVSVAVKKGESEAAELSPPVREEPSQLIRPIETAVYNVEVQETPKVHAEKLNVLKEMRELYKIAALNAKRAGENELALSYVRILRQFEGVIKAVEEEGKDVDLSTMPGPPPGVAGQEGSRPFRPLGDLPSSPGASAISARGTQPSPSLSTSKDEVSQGKSLDESGQPSDVRESQAAAEIPQPKNVLEALEMRLAVFQKQEEKAKSENNQSKARRMGRIVKQYEEAIRLHKAGKPIPAEELPTPPGHPPIPVEGKSVASIPADTKGPPSTPGSLSSVAGLGKAGTGSPSGASVGSGAAGLPPPVPPRGSSLLSVVAVPPAASTRPAAPSASTTAHAPSPTGSTSSLKSGEGGKLSTKQEKQLAALLKRQRQYKEAAVVAKKGGDLDKAKEYLRKAKQFDPLISASKSGLPVDLSTIPVSPADKMEDDFEIVTVTDCLPGTNCEIYERLKGDLRDQLQMCMETRSHYKSIGDVANANKFEQLAVNTKKDLDLVTVLHGRDEPVPKFRYELRKFSIVQCNSDLNDNDLELSIIRGINYCVPNPKEIDTFVKFEFPYPSEEPRRDRTSTVYNTNNPSYGATFIIPIQRTSRVCQRVFKRNSLKLEVWSKGGFLRSDVLVGTTNVKLQLLETRCTIHTAYDLMDGRKPLGGMLEVKIRIRNPIQTKQFAQIEKKWLVLD